MTEDNKTAIELLSELSYHLGKIDGIMVGVQTRLSELNKRLSETKDSPKR